MTKARKYLDRLKEIILLNRNFLFLWLSQIFTQSAVSIVSITIGILSDEGVLSATIRQSATGIGIILFFAMLPGLFVGLIAGVLADWFCKKSIMMISNILRFLLVLAFVLVGGWENLWLSYLLIFLLSFILQFFIPAAGGLITLSVSRKYLLLANSLFSLAVYSTLAIGFAFGGFFLNLFGIGGTFIVCAFLFMMGSILLLGVRVNEKIEKKSFEDIISFISQLAKDVKNGILYAFRKKIVRFALTHLFLLQIAGMILATLVFRIGNEIYSVSPRTAGVVVFSPLVLGLLLGLGVLNIGGKKKNRVALVWNGLILSIIGFSLMSIISLADGFLAKVLIKEIVSTLSLMTIGGAIPFLLVPAQTLIYENTESHFRGRILGIWVALTSSLAACVASGIGFLTDKIGDISFAIILLVALDGIYSIFVYWLFKSKKL